MNEDMSYVAICAHGKVRGAAVICESTKKDMPKYLADFAKWADHIDRMTVEAVRKADWECMPCDNARKAKRKARKP